MSVLYATIADFRGTDFSLNVKDKTLNTFHYKWEEASIDDSNSQFFFFIYLIVTSCFMKNFLSS